MKNDKQKIASKKRGKRQVVDRIQHPIVLRDTLVETARKEADKRGMFVSGVIFYGKEGRYFSGCVDEKQPDEAALQKLFMRFAQYVPSEILEQVREQNPTGQARPQAKEQA